MAVAKDLIDDFARATETAGTDLRFRRWAAISLIAACLGRKVWTNTLDLEPLYPNFYILFVGEAGTGKGNAIRAVQRVLHKLHGKTVPLGPNKITAERLIQRMEKDSGSDVVDGVYTERAAVTLTLGEWGTFLKKQDTDFMAIVADLFDCHDLWEYETKNAGFNHLENVFLNILAACTPAWFSEGFPRDAFEQGLPARLILVYTDKLVELPFGEKAKAPPDELLPRLLELCKKSGPVVMSKPAMDALIRWQKEKWEPAPRDPLLASYCRRRHVHTTKLAVVIAMARHPSDMRVRLSDFLDARKMLEEAEAWMPAALAGAGGNVFQLREDKIAKVVAALYAETGKYVPEYVVRQRMGKLVSTPLLERIIDEMVNKRILETPNPKLKPNRLFKPGKESTT